MEICNKNKIKHVVWIMEYMKIQSIDFKCLFSGAYIYIFTEEEYIHSKLQLKAKNS
jgi:hypothetical protein